jgi:hypothetical protein
MDEAGSWDNLHVRFEVKRINHQEAYSMDDACTNWEEEFSSRIRRAEISIHHHIGERPGLCKIRSRAAHCARASALAVDMDLPIHPTCDPRRDLMIWSRATAIAGSAVVTLASCRIRIVRGHREPRPETAGRWRLALVGCGRNDEGSSVAAFQLSSCHRKHNLPDQLRVRPSSDRSGIA